MRLLALLSLSVIGAVGCGGTDPLPQADAGFADAQTYDAGRLDASPRPDARVNDSGPLDAGFSDPELIRAGSENIQGLNTYLEIYGARTSTNPPVFVLQRGPGTPHEYLPEHFRFLLPGRRVVYYDMRGTGETSYGDGTPTSTITFDQHVLDFAELVDYVGQLPEGTDTRKVDLVGHEYGAAVAMHYAVAHPTRVSRLILLNPYPIDVAQHSQYRAEVQARLTTPERERYQLISEQPQCWAGLSSCALELWNIRGPHHLCPENRDLYAQLTFRHGDYRTESRSIDRALRNSRYSWRGTLGQVTTPTTILSGPCDPIPVATSTTYAGGIPGAQHVVLPRTGQFPMVEAPPVFQANILHNLTHP